MLQDEGRRRHRGKARDHTMQVVIYKSSPLLCLYSVIPFTIAVTLPSFFYIRSAQSFANMTAMHAKLTNDLS
jgi:hypothetical protein